MRKTAIALCLISGSLLLGTSRTDGCGGALMSVGSGVRFSRTSDNPARVLLDASSNSQMAELAPSLQSYLTQKGHKPTTVKSAADRKEAMESGNYDVVMTDLANAASITTATSKLVVVPLTGKLSKVQKSTVEKKYKYQIKDPRDGNEYLEVIDKVMTSRSRKSA